MNREDAIELLRKVGCSEGVIAHALAVEKVALSLAEQIAKKNEIDLKAVQIGSLLHDIGRSKTHGIDHGVVGGEILKKMGLEDFVGFAERHIGAGIPAEEAKKLGLPPRDFMPITIEEKIVAYADKLVRGNEVISFEEALKEFEEKLGKSHPAIGRLKALHREIEELKKGF